MNGEILGHWVYEKFCPKTVSSRQISLSVGVRIIQISDFEIAVSKLYTLRIAKQTPTYNIC